MTIDKIKHYMNADIFDYWVNCKDIALITKACNILTSEINSGILNDIKYHAELKLLIHLKN